MGTVCSEMNGLFKLNFKPQWGTWPVALSFALPWDNDVKFNLPDPKARLAYKAVSKDASRRQRYNEA